MIIRIPDQGVGKYVPSLNFLQEVDMSRIRIFLTVVQCVICLAVLQADAKTRWSSLQLVPNADLLEGGVFLVDVQSYYYYDFLDGAHVKPSACIDLGIIEWINIRAGYTGGFNMGLKARILGETRSWIPTLTIGIDNVFTHKEAYYYGHAPDSLSNELYVILGKSFEPVKLRFHLGVQSIPDNEHEVFNPFLGVEKYFGRGLYLTFELHRRTGDFYASLFSSWRFLKNRFELSAGAVDLVGMLMNADKKMDISLSSSAEEAFVRPGIWVGLKFRGKLGKGKADGFISLEDRITRQNELISNLYTELDSIKTLLSSSSFKIQQLDKSVALLNDSSEGGLAQLKLLVAQKLITIKTLYAQEPFEPEQIRANFRELVVYRDRIVPVLSQIAGDRNEDLQIRVHAVSVLGEIGSRGAADLLIELLGQAQSAEMKIELLIALGKLKETRAVYLMQQLTNDPHDAVAFAAAEILQKLEKETGIKFSKPAGAPPPPASIPERKIGVERGSRVLEKEPVKIEPMGNDVEGNLNPVKNPVFSEATVLPEKNLMAESPVEQREETPIDSLAAPDLLSEENDESSGEIAPQLQNTEPAQALPEPHSEEAKEKQKRKRAPQADTW